MQKKTPKQVHLCQKCGILTMYFQNFRLRAVWKGRIFMLEAGIRGEQSVAVTSENTAKTMGSGTLDVFATPRWWHWPKRPAG